eukprot:8264106-Heterocapsa_arctica.AAC.1
MPGGHRRPAGPRDTGSSPPAGAMPDGHRRPAGPRDTGKAFSAGGRIAACPGCVSSCRWREADD